MRTLLILLLFSYCTGILAQQVVATAGGTLENSNGTMSYTIGEGVAQTLTKGDKTLTQGFHQPNISVIPISKMKDLDFSITVFPNPASDLVTVKVDKEDVSGIQYLLFDMHGKLLSQKNLEGNETIVYVKQLATGLYFLRVQAGIKELRTFKIIKQ
jgi:hypothetical protein